MQSRRTSPKMLLLLVMALSLVGVATATPIFHGIDPTSTFLRTDSIDASVGPVFVYLSAYGISPGMTISLQTLGDFCFTAGDPCTELAAPTVGVFTSDTSVAGTSVLDRLTAIGPPAGITSLVTQNTWFENLTTDISQDFAIPVGSPLSLVVPDGANYLALGVADAFYADNSDPNQDLGVVLEAVPEPGTMTLLALGVGMLLVGGLRRKHSN